MYVDMHRMGDRATSWLKRLQNVCISMHLSDSNASALENLSFTYRHTDPLPEQKHAEEEEREVAPPYDCSILGLALGPDVVIHKRAASGGGAEKNWLCKENSLRNF